MLPSQQGMPTMTLPGDTHHINDTTVKELYIYICYVKGLKVARLFYRTEPYQKNDEKE